MTRAFAMVDRKEIDSVREALLRDWPTPAVPTSGPRSATQPSGLEAALAAHAESAAAQLFAQRRALDMLCD